MAAFASSHAMHEFCVGIFRSEVKYQADRYSLTHPEKWIYRVLQKMGKIFLPIWQGRNVGWKTEEAKKVSEWVSEWEMVSLILLQKRGKSRNISKQPQMATNAVENIKQTSRWEKKRPGKRSFFVFLDISFPKVVFWHTKRRQQLFRLARVRCVSIDTENQQIKVCFPENNKRRTKTDTFEESNRINLLQQVK